MEIPVEILLGGQEDVERPTHQEVPLTSKIGSASYRQFRVIEKLLEALPNDATRDETFLEILELLTSKARPK